MPRTIPNYSQSIIYKLCCNDPEITDIYVGSTTNFSNRKKAHKSICNNENNRRYHLNVYQFIRNNGNWDNWSMIQIEQYKATDKRNLETRERYYIEQLGATLNKITPAQTQEEIRQHQKEFHKQYRERPEYKEKKNKKFECECGSKYSSSHKTHHLRSKKHREF